MGLKNILSIAGSVVGSMTGIPGGGAVGSALGNLVGGAIGGDSGSPANAASDAARLTAEATDRATQLQREIWQKQQADQQPWLQAGQQALNNLIPIASNYTPFGMNQFTADPGYAFRMSEGMKALERSAAARGGLLSGSMLKGAQRYGQGLASQEYQNAFDRYQAERQARLGPLQSLAGVGQTAANTLGAAGQNYATNVGNSLINQGYTAGNAGIAAANARNSMYGNIGSAIGQVPSSQWSSLGNSISNWYNNLGNTNVPGGSGWGMDLGFG